MKYKNIAIERQYASGGREIGEKLAKKLGIPCYGVEILEKASKSLDMSLSELRNLEESITSSVLFGLNMLANITSGKEADLTRAQKLAIAEVDIVKELSLEPCVLVGRGAAGLLKDNPNTLRVFIHSEFNARIDRAVNLYNDNLKNAESVLRKYDKRRANYFKLVTNVEWRDTNIYHLILNSNQLGIDSSVDILYSAVNTSPQLKNE